MISSNSDEKKAKNRDLLGRLNLNPTEAKEILGASLTLTSKSKQKTATVAKKDKDFSSYFDYLVESGSITLNQKAEEAGHSFCFPLVGLEKTGKSSLGTIIALALQEQGIAMKRIQCENTVMREDEYDALIPINPHKVIRTVVGSTKKVRVFPSIITDVEVAAMITDEYVLVDGCARIETIAKRNYEVAEDRIIDGKSEKIQSYKDNGGIFSSVKLAERGTNISAITFALQEIPFLSSGCITCTTISVPALLKDFSAAAQGYIETVEPNFCCVSSPFNRRIVKRVTWSQVLEAFLSEKYSDTAGLSMKFDLSSMTDK